MKKLNSKGSSPLHIVLILVIVGLIAGVGYYVYSSQNKTNTALDNAANSQVDPQKSEKKEEAINASSSAKESAPKENVSTEGWETLSTEVVSVKYPSTTPTH